jgi:hypothetical protein
MIAALVLATAALTGCGQTPRIDASSDAALESSLGRITAGMSNEEKRKFFESCGKFIAPLDPKDKPVPGRVAGSLAARYRQIDGLTAAQVLAKAASESSPVGER